MPTIQELADEAASYLHTATRDDGSTYVTYRENDPPTPDWVSDLVREAHCGMLPDDWRFKCIASALECIAAADDPEDAAYEWAEAQCNVYPNNLIAWLASHVRRPGYVDDAVDLYGIGAGVPLTARIGYGQYAEALEVYAAVLEALEDHDAAGPVDVEPERF